MVFACYSFSLLHETAISSQFTNTDKSITANQEQYENTTSSAPFYKMTWIFYLVIHKY